MVLMASVFTRKYTRGADRIMMLTQYYRKLDRKSLRFRAESQEIIPLYENYSQQGKYKQSKPLLNHSCPLQGITRDLKS